MEDNHKHSVTPGLKKVAVFCILHNGDRYLLLRRKFPPHQGMVVPVGGKLDPYEMPRDAVIREVKEETGIEINNPIFAGTLIETSPIDYNWVSYIYTAEIEDCPAPACDEGELSWYHRDDLDKANTPPTDAFIYQYVLDGNVFAFDALFDKEMKMISMVDLHDNRQLI